MRLFFVGMFLMPILCIIFCLNLVSILKKVKSEEKTTSNTAWLTISFTLIVWSIGQLRINLTRALTEQCCFRKGPFSSKLSVAENFIPFSTKKKPNASALGLNIGTTAFAK